MRNSFRFWMQDSTGHTTPPDTAPLFGPRLRALLGSVLGLRQKYSEPFPTSSGEPERVTEARSRKDISGLTAKQVRKLVSRSAQLESDVVTLSELRNKENAIYRSNLDGYAVALDEAKAEVRDLRSALVDARNDAYAAHNRADMLNAAIQYAILIDTLDWLEVWNEGDEEADNELRAWMGSDDGKAVLGTAVVGRDGMQPVPAPVGRERPEPATVQPTPGAVITYPEGYTPGAGPVSLHPSQINPAYVDFARAYGAKHGDVKIGYGVTCWELGGWVPHPKALQARPDAYLHHHHPV